MLNQSTFTMQDVQRLIAEARQQKRDEVELEFKKKEECNGWSNYETWQIYVDCEQLGKEFAENYISDITEAYETYTLEETMEINLAERLRKHYESEEMLGQYEISNPLANSLLNTALSKVNWLEIAKFLIDEVMLDQESLKENKKS